MSGLAGESSSNAFFNWVSAVLTILDCFHQIDDSRFAYARSFAFVLMLKHQEFFVTRYLCMDMPKPDKFDFTMLQVLRFLSDASDANHLCQSASNSISTFWDPSHGGFP